VLLGCVWLSLDGELLNLKLRALSFDLPFLLRGHFQPQKVLMVSLDKDVVARLSPGQTKLARSWHAKLLEQAQRLGAELVVFDLMFTRPSDDKTEDQQFAAALRAARGKVVLGAKLDSRVEGGTRQWVPIPPNPAFASADWGAVNFPTNLDGRLRQHFAPDSAHPSLAWKAAELVGKAPPDPLRPRWLNYYGPRGVLRTIRYDRFLEQPATATNLFAGQVLFVGWVEEDEHPTSYTRWTRETVPGVELHATAFLNLIRNEWLEELPRWAEYGLIIGLGLALVLGFGRMRATWALPCGFAIFFLLLGSACLLMWLGHWWFPWLIVATVQLPCAALWSAMARQKQLHGAIAQRSEDATVRVAAEAEPRRIPEIPDHVPLRCIGRGAYGEVWLARDVIGIFHAVKVVYKKTFTQEEPFEREFRGIQKFTPISRLHPGWVDILHVGRNEAQGYFYYIMELGDDENTEQQIDPEHYRSKTLSGELRQRGPLPLIECLEIGVALADALEHLHKHGLIHRDIKPSNVIYVRGAPKFADIGLVTDISSRREVSWMGTEGYMAPEGPGTPAADVFGLGKLLYETAMGHNQEHSAKTRTDDLRESVPAEQEELRRIMLKACNEDVTKRYSTAAELRRDLLELKGKQSNGGMVSKH
jgi:CHASE2 domain-containing sensor protein